jgi:hypothetical protein
MSIPKIKRYVAERNTVLVSGDEAKIRAFYKKYGIEAPTDPIVFWGAFHKARTAWTECPLELRLVSLQWLMRHDMKALE